MRLFIDSTVVSGFSSWQVLSRMDSLSDFFSCSIPMSASAHPLSAGKEVEVYMKNEKIMTGFLESVNVDSKEGTLVWTGRDKTGDLIDCFPIASTGEWVNQTAKQIIESLAAPFDISVTGEAGYFFKKFNVNLDLPVIHPISELCSISGLLARSDAGGNIVLENIDYSKSDFVLQQGRNLESYRLTASTREAFSSYTVVGQSPFNVTDATSATKAFNTVTPASPGRYRPFRMINWTPMDYKTAETQADWMMRQKQTDREQVEATLAGLQDIYPNTLIYVKSPDMRIDGIRLVTAVRWHYTNEEGNKTTLTLTNPYRYGGNEEEYTGWLSE